VTLPAHVSRNRQRIRENEGAAKTRTLFVYASASTIAWLGERVWHTGRNQIGRGAYLATTVAHADLVLLALTERYPRQFSIVVKSRLGAVSWRVTDWLPQKRWPAENTIVRAYPFPKRCTRCSATILSTVKQAGAWCDRCGRRWSAPGSDFE